MESVFTLAQRYYPRLWDESRLKTLVKAGQLTEEEYREIIGDGNSHDK